MTFEERFAGDALNLDVWFPYYLPHWSSRAASAATYSIEGGELRLSIPLEQPLWCPDVHEEPLRVSCVQSGSFAGPIGSTIGQQPINETHTVREEQPAFWGYTPTSGRVEVRMRGNVNQRSMFAFWMSGIEDRPERSGEICVAEIFGAGVDDRGAEIGIGVHAFRDPALVEEFSADRYEIDVTNHHDYHVDWGPDGIVFGIDGEVVKRSSQALTYPMQLMLGVFDFPARAAGSLSDSEIPEMFIAHVLGE